MSLLNEVQKFIEAHPGCTSGDIADAFAGYSRQRVLQSASKLRQSGRVAHRCEGDTRRHFPRLTERAQEPEPQPVRETKPVRNFYVGTNDPAGDFVPGPPGGRTGVQGLIPSCCNGVDGGIP